MHIDGFFFNALVAEISREIVGSRVEDVYESGVGELIIRFRSPGKTLRFVVMLPPAAFFLRDRQTPRRNMTRGFSQTIKNQIVSCFCLSFVNPAFDRRGTLAFGSSPQGAPSHFLHIEVMGRQKDVVFCTGELIAVSTRRPQPAATRFLQPGDRYLAPEPAAKAPPDKITGAQLQLLLEQLCDLPCPKALTHTISGVGPLLAKEICFRAGLSHQTAAAVTLADCNRLVAELTSLSAASCQNKTNPVIYAQEGPYWTRLHHLPPPLKELPTLSAALNDWQANYQHGDQFSRLNRRLESALNLGQVRLNKTMAKQELELERAQKSQSYRQIADTLLAAINNIPPRATTATLIDIYTGKPVAIQLDPELSASANAARYYKRYKKYKHAAAKVQAQLKTNLERRAYLESLVYYLNSASSIDELKELASEMEGAGLIRTLAVVKRPAPATDTYLSYSTKLGTAILVGKNNRQNERLTFKTAAKDHFWFHCRHAPGSHVVLCTATPATEEIAYAAGLAAWYSNQRTAPKVEVVWTQLKNVKKIAGAPPGLVKYTDYHSIFIAPVPG